MSRLEARTPKQPRWLFFIQSHANATALGILPRSLAFDQGIRLGWAVRHHWGVETKTIANATTRSLPPTSSSMPAPSHVFSGQTP